MAGISKIASKNLDEVNKINSAVLIGLGTAVVGEVKTGSTFYAGSTVLLTGSGTQTLNPANENVPAGYYIATTLSAVDGDLAVGNIKQGVDIFGFVGTLPAGGVETIDRHATASIADGVTYTPNVSGIFFNGVGDKSWINQYQTDEPAWWRVGGPGSKQWGATAIGDGTNFRIENAQGVAAVYCLMRHYIDTGTYERYETADLGAGANYTPGDAGFFADAAEDADVKIQVNRSDGWQDAYEVGKGVTLKPLTITIGDGTNLRVHNGNGAARYHALMRAVMT